MREIGIRSNILGSYDFISALVYQSLVPINCEDCSITLEEYLAQQDNLDKDKKHELADRISVAAEKSQDYKISNVRFKSKTGCKKCGGRGITNREVIAEVIIPDATMKKYFKEEKDAEAKEYYRKCGGKLIIDHGLDKMFKGHVDPMSLERKAGRMDMSEYSMESMLKKLRSDIENKEKSLSEEDEIKSSLNISREKESARVVEIKTKK